MILKYIFLSLLVAIAIAMSGCASSRGTDYYESRQNRVGLHSDNLISEIGEPSIQLTAPISNYIETVRYVYMNQKDAGNCVDIYVIDKETGTVIDYICQ